MYYALYNSLQKENRNSTHATPETGNQAEPLFIIYNPYYIRTSRSKRTNLFGLLALALVGVLGLLLWVSMLYIYQEDEEYIERTLQ